MIYTAPCIMFWMCAYELLRQGPTPLLNSRIPGPNLPPTCPSNGYARIQNIMHGAVLAIYGPIIYTAPYVMLLLRCGQIHYDVEVGGGWTPGKINIFGPCEIASSRIADPCHWIRNLRVQIRILGYYPRSFSRFQDDKKHFFSPNLWLLVIN